MRWTSELLFSRCNTHKQLKFNVDKKNPNQTKTKKIELAPSFWGKMTQRGQIKGLK